VTYPAERFLVWLTCGVLGFSTQAFYAWSRNSVSLRGLEGAYAINALIDAHGDDSAFGYRCLGDEFERDGIEVGEWRGWQLCSQPKLWSTTIKKGRTGKRPGLPVNDDLLRRNLTAARPDRTWVTDLTEHPTTDGKVYCCAEHGLVL